MTEIMVWVLLAELWVLVGAGIWRLVRGPAPRGGGESSRGAKDGRAGDGGPAEDEQSDFERKWQEGISAMMGYDLTTARKAVKNDEDREI